jgi:hypothetical protein
MLSFKRILIVFIVCLIPFVFYLSYPYVLGFDSYAFVNHVCFNQPLTLDVGSAFVLSLLPCDFVVFKLLLFVCFFVSVLALSFLVDLFDGNGWLGFVFLLASPVWVSFFLNFENDLFALPFLCWAVFFMVKGLLTNKVVLKLLAVFLVCVAALFWQGAFFYLIAFALLWFPVWVLVIPVLVLYWERLLSVLFPSWMVFENVPFFGLLLCGILLVGYLRIPKRLFLATFFLTIVGLMVSKLAFLVVPFLLIGFVLYFFPKIELDGMMKLCLGLIVFAFFVGMFFAVFWGEPSDSFWVALDFAQEQSLDLNKQFKNEWSFGYWVKFKGIDTNAFGYGEGIDCKNSVCLTQFNQDCVLIKRFRQYRVYDCP